MTDESFFMLNEWLQDKRLTWTNRALLSKIYALTIKGTEEKRISNKFFLEIGFTEKELRNSWRELQKCGYICKRIDKLNGNQSYVSFITPSAQRAIPSCPKGVTPSAQRAIPSCPKGVTPSAQRAIPLCPKGVTPSAQRASHHTKVNTISNTKVDTYISDEAEKAPVKIKKEKVTYPQSPEECEAYFLAYIQKYQDERPILRNFPVRMEAEKFFDYWGIERNWKRGRTAIKSIAGCVATWCGNWIDRNQRNYSKTSNSSDDLFNFAKQCCEDVGVPFDLGNKNENDIIDITPELEAKNAI